MKKALFILIILLAIITNGQAQDKLKIGEVRSGKLVITNPDGLRSFFLNSLNRSGTLGKDYQVSTAPEGDRFIIYFPVSGNKDNITSIGVMLIKEKDDVFIIENPPATTPGGGGSVEITCTGVDCSQCVPNIRWTGNNWIPEVYCECRSGGGGKCNMSIKITVKIDVNF
jgi:hypothetical protein